MKNAKNASKTITVNQFHQSGTWYTGQATTRLPPKKEMVLEVGATLFDADSKIDIGRCTNT